MQPYFTITNHGYVGYLVAVNPQFWGSLPDDLRTGLEEIVAEVTAWGNARAAAINADSLDKIEESGRTEIVRLTTEEITVWRNAMQPVWEQFADDIGREVIAAARGDDNH